MPKGIYERKPIIERFWDKVNVKGPDDCWEWLASGNGNGYGQFTIGRVKYYSHRISWVISNGYIPEGKIICHSCDNPGCVNPKHLFIGTQSDNIQDAANKNRLVDNSGSQNGMAKLTKTQVKYIRKLKDCSQVELAKIYNVDRKTINNVINYKTWQHI